ncbi:MAG: endonuclease/exonuclease/phosphatase family protein [Methyloceanibacter sp.]
MTFKLKALAALALAAGLAWTVLGRLEPLWPALDIVNNGLPFLLAGLLAVLLLAAFARDWRLIAASMALLAFNLWLAISSLQGAAAEAVPGSERTLRVITFNVWYRNDRMQDVAKFLAASDADIVTLQEVSRAQAAMLRETLKPELPFVAGEANIVILSKHPILATGRIDRPGFPEWNSLMLRWVRLDLDGSPIEFAGVHLARPFYPTLLQEDVEALTDFVLRRRDPLIVAGDYNMTPWSEKLARYTYVTGLKRYNSFHQTWPMRRGRIPLLPLAATDNVFASNHFAKLGVEGAPRLGSDHKAVITDLALAAPPHQAR